MIRALRRRGINSGVSLCSSTLKHNLMLIRVEYEGMLRVKEVLETHDWSASTGSQDLDADPDIDFGSDDDLEKELLGFSGSADTPGFGHEVHELEREMLGLRMAIERGGGDGVEDDEKDEELKVESMDALMMRMSALRGMSDCNSEVVVVVLIGCRYGLGLARGRAQEIRRKGSARYHAAAIK